MRLHFTYKNYRGEVDEREVIVHHVRNIATDWHPEKQWIVTALDVKKNEMRDFAMRDMSNVRPTPTLFLLTADVLRNIMGRLNELQNQIHEVGAGPTDELTRLVTEAKSLLQTVMKGTEAQEPESVLPTAITPEIREVLRMQPWRIDTLASALRAAGHGIGKRHEDATAAVKFLLLHFVLKHGTSWHSVFKKYLDGGVSDGMKYLHTLPGYEDDGKPKPPDCLPGSMEGMVWPGHEQAMRICICGKPIEDGEPLHDGRAPVSMFDYFTTNYQSETDGEDKKA